MPFRLPILVVDDNDDHVLLLRRAFQKAGIRSPVQVAVTGEDAIVYLGGTGNYSNWRNFPLPSIVLLDLKLPGLNGFEVLRWVRQHPGLKPLRIAMLTSSFLPEEVDQAHQMGANVFLTKPVDLDNLIEMMKVFRAHWLELAQLPTVTRRNAR
jgi:CheY-like chemotaxis protein